MNGIPSKYFSLFIFLITLVSANRWSSIPFGNQFIDWGVYILCILYCINFLSRRKGLFQSENYKIVAIFIIWILICTIRGIFVAENYWEYKQLVNGAITLSLPLLVYPLSVPQIMSNVLAYWLKYAIPAFFLFFIWVIPPGAYHFYLGPVLTLSCFLPIIPKKWRYLFIALLALMLIADLGARSQVIKAAMALLISVAYLFAKYISDKILRLVHWFCYLLPVVFLVLGISGVFNIFKGLSENEGKYKQIKMVDGQLVEEDLSADTRTFIYVEVIESALRHHYVIWGRTPARGNDSVTFGAYMAEFLKTGKFERHANEICHTNIFTWTGFIGLILYSLIYLRSSYLAVYRSENLFMKLVGVFIAFRWAYGWVEDVNSFDIANISLWMLIAMGLSPLFRQMTNREFKAWVQGIFNKKITALRRG